MKMYEEQEIVILLTEIRTINNTKELDTQVAALLQNTMLRVIEEHS